MKRMLAGLIMILLASASAQAADQRGMMGGRMMEMMKGMVCEGHNPWFHQGVTLLLRSAEKLGLDEKQKGQLEEFRTRYSKEIIRQNAELDIAEIDLEALLKKPDIDLSKVKETIKKVKDIEGQIRYLRVEAFAEARKVLTDEQRGKLNKLMEKPMAPMMMQEMMGRMMEDMGGMMGKESEAEGPMTQEKAAGEVTVVATFKNPESAGGKDDLVFHVKFDTHTVDLDKYNIEKGVILKDDNDMVYKPSSVKPSGSGHHREADVSFKNPGKVKYLKLAIKALAGVKETEFKWEIEKEMMGD